jgi:autotransporter-associated beta strand protein
MTGDFGGNTTWIYSGYLVVTGAAAATYSFAESIDDNTWLKIDDTVLINDGAWNVPTLGTIVLTPGLHRFEVRFYNGGGGFGPQAQGWWTNNAIGFGFDPLGRNQQVRDHYQAVVDPGDGSFLCTEVTVTNDILLAADARVKVSNRVGPTNALAGVISGGFGLTKIGDGALALHGSNSYAGATAVSNGSMFIHASHLGVGAITVASNALLAGTGTVSAAATTVRGGGCVGARGGGPGGTLTLLDLFLEDGARVACQLNGTNPTIAVTAALTTAGTVPVEVYASADPVAPGSYPLIRYATLGGAGFGAFALALPLPNGAQGFLSNNVADSTVDLVVTNTGDGLRWSGAVHDAWDVASTYNWTTLADALPALYYQGNAVRFDDLATGSATVLLTQAMTPASVTVSNDSLAYRLVGAHGLGGAGGLTKQGPGTLTIATAANTYSGLTTVAAGTVRFSAVRPFGHTTGVVIQSGGQVDLNGMAQAGVQYTYTIAGAGPDGRGALVNTNATVYHSSTVSYLSLSGDATVGAYGPGTNDAGRFDISLGGWFDARGFTLTKQGLAMMALRGVASNVNNVVVQQGILSGENVNDSLGHQCRCRGRGEGRCPMAASRMPRPLQLNGGFLTSLGGAPSRWTGLVTLGADATVDTLPRLATYNGADIYVDGRITGAYGLSKLGSNTLVLAGASDFAGPLTIHEGTIRLAGGPNRLPTNIVGDDQRRGQPDAVARPQRPEPIARPALWHQPAGVAPGAGRRDADPGGPGRCDRRLLRRHHGRRLAGPERRRADAERQQRVHRRHHVERRPPAPAPRAGPLGTNALVVNGGRLTLDAAGLWEGRLGAAFETAATKLQVGGQPAPWTSRTCRAIRLSAITRPSPYSGYLKHHRCGPCDLDVHRAVRRQRAAAHRRARPYSNNTVWNVPTKNTITLAPGWHTFDLRLGNGGGPGGPNAGWNIGFGVDFLGRDALVVSNFVPLIEPGDGSLFLRDDLALPQAVTLNADLIVETPVGRRAADGTDRRSGRLRQGGAGGGCRCRGRNSYAGATPGQQRRAAGERGERRHRHRPAWPPARRCGAAVPWPRR